MRHPDKTPLEMAKEILKQYGEGSSSLFEGIGEIDANTCAITLSQALIETEAVLLCSIDNEQMAYRELAKVRDTINICVEYGSPKAKAATERIDNFLMWRLKK